MSYPWRPGNHITLLENGEEFFPRVFQRIRQAQSEVLIQTYILYEDPVGEQLRSELIAAAGRGVRVELTMDDFGSPDLSQDFMQGLADAGVGLHRLDYRPRLLGKRVNPFRRMHNKVMVVDGQYGFLGGINFCIDHLVGSGPMAMQDYGIEIQGPALADIRAYALGLLAQGHSRFGWLRHKKALAAARAPDTTGDMQARFVIRDNKWHKADIEKQYRHAIRKARQRLIIANAYFFPGLQLLRDIRNAAQRGVQVQLILQGRPDVPIAQLGARMLYAYLMGGGVEIYEYQRRPLHAKVALADGQWATVGSSNLDPSSLALNLETNLLIKSTDFNAALANKLECLLENCQQLTPAEARRWRFWRAPVIAVIFQFLKRFPAWARLLPAHRLRLATFRPRRQGLLQARHWRQTP